MDGFAYTEGEKKTTKVSGEEEKVILKKGAMFGFGFFYTDIQQARFHRESESETEREREAETETERDRERQRLRGDRKRGDGPSLRHFFISVQSGA